MAIGKLLLLCAFVVCATCYTEDNKCDIPLNFTTEFWELEFINKAEDDDFNGDTFFSFHLPDNVTEWELGSYQDSPYIKAEVNDRVVTVKPTDAFSRLEYTEFSSKPLQLSLNMKFICGQSYGDWTEFTFKQIINDVNNHEPTFNRKEYKYHFGMELKEGAVLTDVMEIYAVDIDFTNDDVTFSIEDNDWFEIQHKRNDNGKKIYYPTLKTKKVVPKADYSYKITATDNGTPPKKGTANIYVKIE